MGREKVVFLPREHRWETGYKPRNIQIARHADIVHCIVLAALPPNYTGAKYTFPFCYHCATARPPHVKSGGCWTAKYAERIGKQAKWWIV